MKTSIFSGISTAIALLSAGVLQAQLINVDFNGNSVGQDYGGGGVASPGPNQSGAALIGSAGDVWNSIADSQVTFATYPSGITATALPLMFSTGINSPVTLSFTAGGSYNANEPNWGNTSAFTTAGSPYSNLMQDEMYTTPAASATLSGLAANQNYNLIIYSAGDQNLQINGDPNVYTSKVGTFTVNGITQTTTWYGTQSTLINGQTYVEFAATSDGSGNLNIIWGGTAAGTGINPETDWNGFQLMAVPEPASLAILGVAGLMFVGWRRRVARA